MTCINDSTRLNQCRTPENVNILCINIGCSTVFYLSYHLFFYNNKSRSGYIPIIYLNHFRYFCEVGPLRKNWNYEIYPVELELTIGLIESSLILMLGPQLKLRELVP